MCPHVAQGSSGSFYEGTRPVHGSTSPKGPTPNAISLGSGHSTGILETCPICCTYSIVVGVWWDFMSDYK
jgi:hypothetical protein